MKRKQSITKSREAVNSLDLEWLRGAVDALVTVAQNQHESYMLHQAHLYRHDQEIERLHQHIIEQNEVIATLLEQMQDTQPQPIFLPTHSTESTEQPQKQLTPAVIKAIKWLQVHPEYDDTDPRDIAKIAPWGKSVIYEARKELNNEGR